MSEMQSSMQHYLLKTGEAITADDCEYLAMKQMNAIRPGLGGRAAWLLIVIWIWRKAVKQKKIGHTSVINIPE
jgi:hypothetical protein